LALPLSAEERVSEVMRAVSVLPSDVKLPASATRVRLSTRAYSHVGPITMIDLIDKPLAGWQPIVKRVFDITLAAIALVVLAPVFAVTAAAVAWDSRGPVLFRQKRFGFNNDVIDVLKFRSMYIDNCDAAASRLVTRDDPRVTRVGRFIRKTSLDELPQLINVLRGELSLVGPRPHAPEAKAAGRRYDTVVDGYFARHKVKPGMTGWAQICGWRGETDTEDKIERRVACDLYYVDNWSLWLDVYIVLMTPIALIRGTNAY
jgi:exopolysaccharide biosynthesis polyprenyl glycosylphosphotransferase